MTDPIVPVGDGHTPLSEDELRGLKLSYVTTRGELNEAEQANILDAIGRPRSPGLEVLLDDQFLRRLHGEMFGQVWDWAGTYRRSETNIGIDPHQIAPAVRNLVADARVWIQEKVYESDELAVRFHHRLVQIHPFPNGNGRLGRVAADYLVAALGRQRFTWGANSGLTTEGLRVRYLAALRRADQGDPEQLLAFARS